MGVDVGHISFNETTELERPMLLLEVADAQPTKDKVDALESGGNTGIGIALQSSVTEFQRAALVAALARFRPKPTIFGKKRSILTLKEQQDDRDPLSCGPPAPPYFVQKAVINYRQAKILRAIL